MKDLTPVDPTDLDTDVLADEIVDWLEREQFSFGETTPRRLSSNPAGLESWLNQVGGQVLPPPSQQRLLFRPSATIGFGTARGNQSRREQHANLLRRHAALRGAAALLAAVENASAPFSVEVLRWWVGDATSDTLELPREGSRELVAAVNEDGTWQLGEEPATVRGAFQAIAASGCVLGEAPSPPLLPAPPTIPLWLEPSPPGSTIVVEPWQE